MKFKNGAVLSIPCSALKLFLTGNFTVIKLVGCNNYMGKIDQENLFT